MAATSHGISARLIAASCDRRPARTRGATEPTSTFAAGVESPNSAAEINAYATAARFISFAPSLTVYGSQRLRVSLPARKYTHDFPTLLIDKCDQLLDNDEAYLVQFWSNSFRSGRERLDRNAFRHSIAY